MLRRGNLVGIVFDNKINYLDLSVISKPVLRGTKIAFTETEKEDNVRAKKQARSIANLKFLDKVMEKADTIKEAFTIVLKVCTLNLTLYSVNQFEMSNFFLKIA